MKLTGSVFVSFLLLLCNSAAADVINVAVASNFRPALIELAADFQHKTGHVLQVSSASSGKLFAQIKHGAPYDLFLSADQKRPDLLIQQGMASADNAYVYAQGRLVLLSNVETGGDCRSVLESAQLKRLAIANPDIAPYGLAAKQTLQQLGLWQRLQQRLVTGENIAQTFHFVSTKNASAGFVSQSMIKLAASSTEKKMSSVCSWQVPSTMHQPIDQKMLLLNRAIAKPAAQEFLKYIQSTAARNIIQAAGYGVR